MADETTDGCEKCGFYDCLRGGCTGQNVIEDDVEQIHKTDPSFNTMLLQVKYSGKIEESRYIFIEPDNRKNTKMYKALYALWQEAFFLYLSNDILVKK